MSRIARERLEGARLRIINYNAARAMWAEPLLGPYIERRIEELLDGAKVSVIIKRHSGLPRALRSERAIQHAIGMNMPVWRRPDGKPEVIIGRSVNVSTAHVGDLTIAVAGSRQLACDAEIVVARPASVWQDLLGQDGSTLSEMIARETGEDINTAATRVWTAHECLKKAGAVVNMPLTLCPPIPDGWVKLAAGRFTLAICSTSIRGIEGNLVFGLLARRGNASL